MKKKLSSSENTIAVAITCLLGVGVIASAQSVVQDRDPSHLPGTYTVKQSGRPLAEILLQLQHAFLSPINYEEVPYENNSELRSRAISTLRGPKILRFTQLTDFTATLTEADSNPYLALHSVLSQYKQAGLYEADSYKIIQWENYIEVLPIQVLAANGSKRQVNPVMEHPITFSENKRTVEQTLELLVGEISKASGKQVSLMGDPFTVLDGEVSVGADAELPSQILAKIGASAGVTLSYQCLYDASDTSYYVNIYPVAGRVERELVQQSNPGSAADKSAKSEYILHEGSQVARISEAESPPLGSREVGTRDSTRKYNFSDFDGGRSTVKKCPESPVRCSRTCRNTSRSEGSGSAEE